MFMVAMGTNASEPQSSIFRIEFLGLNVNVNSSQESDTCAVSYRSGASGDLHFRYDSITSDYGILYDETVDRRIKSLINPDVFDLQGKAIQKISKKSNSRYTFNGPKMSRETYLLRIKAGDYQETRQILVK